VFNVVSVSTGLTMTRTPTRPIVVTSLAGVLVLSLSGVAVKSQVPAVPRASEAQLATVKQYCAGCHSDRTKAGGVSFEGLTPESIGQHADVFEKAVRKLRGRVMPPPGARQPDAASIDSLVAWLEESLDHASQPHAGTGHPHRLNRRRANAVRILRSTTRRLRDGRHRRGLREHRDGVAGVAVLHQQYASRPRRRGSRRGPMRGRRATFRAGLAPSSRTS
jgi:mono/diheme cytochrome c family protein